MRAALSLPERVMVEGSAQADVLLRTALSSVITGVMVPWALSPDARKEHERLEFYAELGREQDAKAVFPRPEPDIEVKTRPLGRPKLGAPDQAHSICFESPFVALNPAARNDYAGLKRNRTAWAQHWRHGDEPRPTICVIHGFGASYYWLNAYFFELRWFFKQGYDILLYTMPLHQERRSRLSPMNGLEMFAHGFSRFSESIFHGVHDFRVFLDYLEGLGVERIGVTGLSLGGYMTSLMAAIDERLYFAIPNAPVVRIVDLLDSWFPASIAAQIGLRLHGMDVDHVRAALAAHSPLNYEPLLPKDRLMIIGGLGDRLAPPEQSELVWEHWGRPRLHWYPGNHTVHIRRSDYLREMKSFMRSTGFLDGNPEVKEQRAA